MKEFRFLDIIKHTEPEPQPVPKEQIDAAIDLVENPPEESVLYAQAQIDFMKELGSEDPVKESLQTFIDGGNVSATLGILHHTQTDPVLRFKPAIKAYKSLAKIYSGTKPQDALFKDPDMAQYTQHQIKVLKSAEKHYVEINTATVVTPDNIEALTEQSVTLSPGQVVNITRRPQQDYVDAAAGEN